MLASHAAVGNSERPGSAVRNAQILPFGTPPGATFGSCSNHRLADYFAAVRAGAPVTGERPHLRNVGIISLAKNSNPRGSGMPTWMCVILLFFSVGSSAFNTFSGVPATGENAGCRSRIALSYTSGRLS